MASGDDAGVRVVLDGDVEILTDAPTVDLERVVSHLRVLRKRLAVDFPAAGESGELTRLLIFAKDSDYRRFPERLGERLGRSGVVPQSDGFTLLNIAGTVFDPQWGDVRPTVTHESVHARLAVALGIDNSGEWFHEGVASHYQLHFHPQPDINRIVTQGLAKPNGSIPLQRLCNGEEIPSSSYWQAASLIRMLLEEESTRGRLGELVERMHAAGSTNLAPHLELLGAQDFDGLTRRWRAFSERTWRDQP